MQRINKDDLLKDLKRVYLESGNKISKTIYRDNGGKYDCSTFQRTFGSWNEALRLIGAEEYKRGITSDEIIEDILRVRKDYGKVSKSFYAKYGAFSVNTAKRVIGDGSWNNAIRKAGLEVNQEYISDEKLLNELKRLYGEYGQINAQLIKEQSIYSTTVYVDRFGLNNAIEMAGLPVENRYGFSKSADIVIKMAEDLLNEKAIRECKFDWLVNPLTGRNLYLDAYFPNNNICLEYNGEQHYREDAFGFSSEDFQLVVYRDKIKKQLVEERGIKLIYFSYNEPLDKDYLKNKLCV